MPGLIPTSGEPLAKDEVTEESLRSGACGHRLDHLLEAVYERLMHDLDNKKKAVDWVGVMRLLRLFGTALDKDKYVMTAQGMSPASQASLRPGLGRPLLIGLGRDEPAKPDAP
jgi:hypothetical protein